MFLVEERFVVFAANNIPLNNPPSKVGWVCQQAVQRCGAPGSTSLGRGDAELQQALSESLFEWGCVADPYLIPQ